MSDICAPWAGVDVFGWRRETGSGERSASVCGHAQMQRGDGYKRC